MVVLIISISGSFPCESTINAIHDQSFFSVEKSKEGSSKIQVRNFQVSFKEIRIPFDEILLWSFLFYHLFFFSSRV